MSSAHVGELQRRMNDALTLPKGSVNRVRLRINRQFPFVCYDDDIYLMSNIQHLILASLSQFYGFVQMLLLRPFSPPRTSF